MNDLKEKIENEELKPGDILPSESRLSKQYDASRMSVRKGLSMLTGKGYITAVAGKGYFVNEPKNDKYILYFDEADFLRQYVDEIRVHKVDITSATEAISKELGLKPEHKVISIRNIFYHDSKPIAYDIKYLPYNKGKPIVEQEIGYATYPAKVLVDYAGFSTRKELTFYASLSNRDTEKILELPSPQALMVIEQRYLDTDSKPVLWCQLMVLNEYCRLNALSSK